MDFNEWIKNNIPAFNTKVITEEDFQNKALIPYLKSLGYEEDDFTYQRSISVVIGSKKTDVRSDVNISINGKVELIIDAKRPENSISEKDVLQSASYAKLISTPPAIYGVTTNGRETFCTNIYTGAQDYDIPTKAELMRAIDKTKKKALKEVDLREIKSVLFTITNQDELFKVINECKDIIEKRGLIRSDQSFKEMTKIILVKMNEERRVKADHIQNRFTVDYLKSHAAANNITPLESFRNLFNEAQAKYPDIYTNDDEALAIKDEACIMSLVEKLESFSFLGTGEDIKGAVYEIFLKATLRGDFDQYFTPRELVNFMVQFADPNIGDIILDPACGSGGFLISAFNYVNRKILTAGLSEVDMKNKFKELVDKCLWGGEADYDLHVLAKINLIMHGDGWNNIKQGDTLRSKEFPDNYFDLVLENPPFTIPYTFKDVLEEYEMGRGGTCELDILFAEKSIKAVKPGHDIFIILPEGLMNLPIYRSFRKFLLDKCDLVLSVSLPEGAFIPFGESATKACVLGLRKKTGDDVPPEYVFVGKAVEIGYETGKKIYKSNHKNDLINMINDSKEIFTGIKNTVHGAEYGWVRQSDLSDYRIDAPFLLNILDRESLKERFHTIVPLKELCSVENITEKIEKDSLYNYLEIPDISDDTGVISNIRIVEGGGLKGDSYYAFGPGDILFTRINPKISRVAVIPNSISGCLCSKEAYRIVYKKNKYIREAFKYSLVALLRSKHVQAQMIRLATGSSSSRARVQEDDLLNDVYVPVPKEEDLEKMHDLVLNMSTEIWDASQKYLTSYAKLSEMMGDDVPLSSIRRI